MIASITMNHHEGKENVTLNKKGCMSNDRAVQSDSN